MKKKAGNKKKGTLTDNIYMNLKKKIISGHLKPSETLNLMELAKMFSTSITPINAAISILADEGLVIKKPNKSTIVAAMSIDEVKQAWLTGALFEGMASYLAAPKLSPKEIRYLEKILQNMKEKKAPADNEKLIELNKKFHRTIIESCGNQELLRIIKENSWQRYRYYHLVLSLEGNLSELVMRHELILENIKKRDPRGTREAMEEHIIFHGEKVIMLLEMGV